VLDGQQKAMQFKTLGQTEVVLLGSSRAALGLAYSPGETPRLCSLVRGAEVADFLWSAQEMGVPIVECLELDDSSLTLLREGEEIPELLFRPAAQAIALVQRSQPGPVPVKLVKALEVKPEGLARRWKSRVADVQVQLESSRLWIEVKRPEWVAPAENLSALHRERLQSELGLPLVSLSVRCQPELDCDGQIQVQGLVEYRWNAGENEDFGDLMAGLHEVVSGNAHRLLGFRETQVLVEGLRRSCPGLYKSLFPRYLTVSGLRQVLRNLLREGIKIRNLSTILETIEEHKERTQDPDYLTEFVRASLDFQLCREYADPQGTLHAMLVQPEIEACILKDVHQTSAALWFDMDVDASLKLLSGVARGLEKAGDLGHPAVLLCSPRPRRFLRRLVEPSFPKLPVMSFAEVAPETDVRVFYQLAL